MLIKKLLAFLGLILTSVACLVGCKSVLALSEHTGLWTGFVVVGPAKFGPTIKYYFDSQLQLLDDPYKFEEVYSSVGLGKQVNDRWLLFIVNRFSISKELSDGQMNYEYMLWEEANWSTVLKNALNVSTRSRLEERKRFSESEISLRLRERIMFRKPLRWPGYTFVISEEAFFNLNHPAWVSNQFFAQNRVFIGFGKELSKKMQVDIGYLNKFQFGDSQQMTNILAINFNITGKSHYFKE